MSSEAGRVAGEVQERRREEVQFQPRRGNHSLDLQERYRMADVSEFL